MVEMTISFLSERWQGGLQMFAASGVWQTYADVTGPIEAAFLVPIRTKPTLWLELRFICLQLLGRLRPT